MKNKLKGSRFMEFLTLFLMVVGTTVGGGIYLKNKELLGQTQNPIIAIILWAVVGAVCVLSMIVFMEISSSTKNKGNGTIGNWTKLFINRKTASFFSIIYVVAYVPTIYALFAGSFIYYLFLLTGVDIPARTQLIVYLVVGVCVIAIFSVVNGLKPKWSKGIQVFGTIFKFMPLAIAFVAGFCLIKTSGPDQTAMWNGGAGTEGMSWSNNSNWQGFIRGFGAILLSFDGYIYLANAQKDAVHKDVVPKALLWGLIVVAIFYTLMAVSLFVGSKDGSIFSLFEKLFGGKNDNFRAGNIVGDVIMMIICIININVISMVGTVQIESDSAAKTLYTGKGKHVVSKFKSAMVSGLATIIIYCVLIILGFFIKTNGNDGWTNYHMMSDYGDLVAGPYALTFINIMSSVGAIISFAMVTTLIFGMIANRFSHKVEVDKKKGAFTMAWISGILFFIFIVLGIYTFLDPNNGKYGGDNSTWTSSSALPFLIIFIVMMAVSVIAWLVQEKLFKIYPFKDGFEGQLEDEDPRPYIFKFNPIKNYYTKSGTKEAKKYLDKQKRH